MTYRQIRKKSKKGRGRNHEKHTFMIPAHLRKKWEEDVAEIGFFAASEKYGQPISGRKP